EPLLPDRGAAGTRDHRAGRTADRDRPGHRPRGRPGARARRRHHPRRPRADPPGDAPGADASDRWNDLLGHRGDGRGAARGRDVAYRAATAETDHRGRGMSEPTSPDGADGTGTDPGSAPTPGTRVESPSIARSSAIMAAGSLASRVLGLVRNTMTIAVV